MNPQDLAAFNQAVMLAQAGQKAEAYTRLKDLSRGNPTDPNLWLWLTFTTPSLDEAAYALDQVARLEPFNPNLESARGWLWQEKQKRQPAPPPQTVSIPVASVHNESSYTGSAYSPSLASAIPGNGFIAAPAAAALSDISDKSNSNTASSYAFVFPGTADIPGARGNPVLLFGIALLGGLLLGLATGVVAQLVYLIFLFPILLGVIAARIIWWGLQRSAVKNMMLGVLAAVLLSLATYGAYQYTEYLFFQGEVKNEAQSEGVIASDQMIDRLLQKEVGATGFVGFLRLEAREGIRIGRVTSSSSNNGVALQGDWVWFYWLAELVAITGLTVRRVIISLETPYCKNCRHWYNRRGLLGNVALNRAPHFLEGLRTKNYGQAAEYVSTRAEPTPRLDVEVEICGSCQTSDVSVNVNRVVYRAFGGPDKKQIFTTMLPYPQYTELVKQVQARRAY